jgi:hypothetical protein
MYILYRLVNGEWIEAETLAPPEINGKKGGRRAVVRQLIRSNQIGCKGGNWKIRKA